MFTLDTIFENEHFLCIVKPPGVLSVPSRLGKEDPRPCLINILNEQLPTRIWPIHRLDYEVGGLILLAKNAATHSLANSWFERRLIQKKYSALTGNTNPHSFKEQDSFVWEHKLLRGKKRSYIQERVGKNSVTEARIQKYHASSQSVKILWEVHPLTGRSHQIRFTLSHHGFPILGDVLYGGEPASFLNRNEIALFAQSLNFALIEHDYRLGLPDVIKVPSENIWDSCFD